MKAAGFLLALAACYGKVSAAKRDVQACFMCSLDAANLRHHAGLQAQAHPDLEFDEETMEFDEETMDQVPCFRSHAIAVAAAS